MAARHNCSAHSALYLCLTKMNIKYKLRTLFAACFFIVGLLAYIQYYLVRNTYELTKDQYAKEVKTAANRILGDQPGLEKRVLQSFMETVISPATRNLNEEQFLSQATFRIDSVTRILNQAYNRAFHKSTMLKSISYKVEYDELVIEIKGNRHVLTSAANKQFTRGSSTSRQLDNLIQVRTFQGSFDGKSLALRTARSELNTIKILFKGRQQVDVSGWNQELMKRMSGIFLLAFSLLLAVATLFYLMFRAILEQKKIADVQTDFTNNITHELKTPLSSTGVMLKSLAKKEVQNSPELLNELVASLNRQQQKIQQTVDSVLESAMIMRPDTTLTEAEIPLYLKAYVKDLKLAAHKLQVRIEPEHQLIKAHLPSVEKALNNLIDNAVKYSPKGTVISLNAYVDEPEYLIEIADQGPGIARSYQEQIFSKFYRIPEQNKHTVKGLGLGLYISRQAIEQSGGRLTLTSRQGQGCTFTIKLPLNES